MIIPENSDHLLIVFCLSATSFKFFPYRENR